jgi:hypothetical protein
LGHQARSQALWVNWIRQLCSLTLVGVTPIRCKYLPITCGSWCKCGGVVKISQVSGVTRTSIPDVIRRQGSYS